MERSPTVFSRSAVLTSLITIVLLSLGCGLLYWLDRPSPPSVVYRSVDGFDLTLDVYRPDDWAENDIRPCVIWFFGGGWEVGAPFQYSRHAEELVRQGVVSITPDYRVRSRHGREISPFESLEDGRAAVAWVVSHAGELGIDPGRIALAGGSSGGHLAAACATVPDEKATLESGTAPRPAALILFNPVVDFEIPAVAERTNREERERLRSIAPIHRMREALPPTLIFHGTADAIVPIATSEAFVQRARENGSTSVEFIRYPGERHEFHLGGAASRQQFRKSLGEITRFLASLGWLED